MFLGPPHESGSYENLPVTGNVEGIADDRHILPVQLVKNQIVLRSELSNTKIVLQLEKKKEICINTLPSTNHIYFMRIIFAK